MLCVLGMTAVTYWNHWLMELQYSVLVSVAMVLHSWPQSLYMRLSRNHEDKGH